jgi:hypothetical protein
MDQNLEGFLEILTFFGHRNIAKERVNLISGLKLTYFEKNGQKGIDQLELKNVDRNYC